MHVDLRLSQMNKDVKSKKRDTQPVSEAARELRANNSRVQFGFGNSL